VVLRESALATADAADAADGGVVKGRGGDRAWADQPSGVRSEQRW
jgi:hypothetical protein